MNDTHKWKQTKYIKINRKKNEMQPVGFGSISSNRKKKYTNTMMQSYKGTQICRRREWCTSIACIIIIRECSTTGPKCCERTLKQETTIRPFPVNILRRNWPLIPSSSQCLAVSNTPAWNDSRFCISFLSIASRSKRVRGEWNWRKRLY